MRALKLKLVCVTVGDLIIFYVIASKSIHFAPPGFTTCPQGARHFVNTAIIMCAAQSCSQLWRILIRKVDSLVPRLTILAPRKLVWQVSKTWLC